MLPILLKDGYKVDHRRQYPEGTEFVYSNLTPRSSYSGEGEGVIFVGLQYFIMEYLDNKFKEFFNSSIDEMEIEYHEFMLSYLGPNSVGFKHFRDLHELGYLPIEIKALPEGSFVKYGVPLLTIKNTHKSFFWLTNMLETIISSILWKPITSATTAYNFKKNFVEYFKKTGSAGNEFILDLQGHDFSFRGLSGLEDAMLSGFGHLTSFSGTDTLPAIEFAKKYYGAKNGCGLSVAATEHSVMCMGGEDNEIKTFERIIDLYKGSIVSVVSDTWDFWKVIIEYLPVLKDKVSYNTGKLVIRPDSGDPVKILCGDPDSQTEHEKKGLIEVLWDIFPGKENNKGYKELPSFIGAIYGDSINISRQKEILSKLEKKGFASTNIVLGIGSFSYQFVTRDTHGLAMKATWGQVNGEARPIFKSPKTGASKKSAKGLLSVSLDDNGDYFLNQDVSKDEEKKGELKTVYLNGSILNKTSLNEIRDKVNKLIK